MLRSPPSASLIVASLALSLVGLAGGCDDGSPDDGGEGEGEGGVEGEGEAAGEGEGEGEAVGEGEGEEPPPPPPPPNDTCGTAEELVPGTRKTGTTIGATSETPCPDARDFFAFEGGADVAYVFTIDAAVGERGVRIQASENNVDVVVSLFNDDRCGADAPDQLASDRRTCVDQSSIAGETIEVGALPPGSYFVVVESFGEPGSFELDLELVEPFCEGDADDLVVRGGGLPAGNETAATALSLSVPGASGNGFLSQDSSTVVDEVELRLCDGDVDYYLFGHLGGPLTIDVQALTGATAGGAVVEVREATVDVAATLDTDGLVYVEGPPIDGGVAGGPGVDTVVAAGFYLLKLSEDQTLTGSANVAYDVVIDHLCEADDLDLPIAALDLDFESQQEPAVLPLEAPVARSLCNDDVDLIPFESLFAGPLSIVFAGSGGRDVVIDLFSVDAAGVETPVAANRIDDEGAGTLTFTAEVEPGAFLARVTAPGQTVTTPYTWDIRFPGLDGVPENDLCASAELLVSGQRVAGRTIGAAGEYNVGTCNFEQPGEDPPAADVFYRFNVAAPADVRLTFTGFRDYFGAVSLLKLPAGGCPSDLSTLEAVVDEDAFAVCDFLDDSTQVRELPALAAGDYLVVVDNFGSFGGEPSASGLFQMQADVFPDGFPAACDDGSLRDIVVSDVSQTLSVTSTEFFSGVLGPAEATDNCTTAAGDELVFRFTPATSGTLTARTFDDDIDTILYLRTACDSPTGEVCDDDDAGARDDTSDSFLVTPVEAGTTYFLVLDSFSGPFSGAGASIEIVVN